MSTTTRPDAEAGVALSACGASTVCAVIDMLGIGGIVLGLGMVAPGQRYAGPAFTVKLNVGERGSASPAEFDISAWADHAADGHVIAIDAGSKMVSVSGGIAVAASLRRGVAGWVVDGGMRDVDELRESGMPIHLRHGVAVSGRGRVRLEAVGVPIRLAGIEVAPGDMLVGDSSGVGCFPAPELQRVLRMSNWITGRDDIARRLVLQGKSFKAAFTEATAEYSSAHGELR